MLTMRDRQSTSTREATHLFSLISPTSIITEVITETRRCSKCKEVKKLTEFGKNAAAKDGIRTTCKSCMCKATLKSLAKKKAFIGEDAYNTFFVEKSKKQRKKTLLKLGPEVIKERVKTYNITSRQKRIKKFGKDAPKISAIHKANFIKTNSEAAYKHYMSMNSIKSTYGITEIDFQNLMNIQKGCCAICGADFGTLNKRASIDHNHKTGQVRSLLCQPCNTLIGHAKENKSILAKAESYLEEHTS